MNSVTFLILGILLVSYLWIERYWVTPSNFFIYYVLFSIALFAAVI